MSQEKELVPARMVNEVVYCPRLFYLEWVDREFEDNHFTVDGSLVHARVDAGSPTAPLKSEDEPWQARSVELSSEQLGVSGKIDVVESHDGEVYPVDVKRGRAPDLEQGAYDPERVQLCLYGLLLREQGYRVSKGELYFAASRKRVEIPFDDALIKLTLDSVALARLVAARPTAPVPLVGSSKCDGCSLQSLCLPDEINLLRGASSSDPRPVVTARDDAHPVYVQEAGARVGVSGSCLEVKDRERTKRLEMPLVDLLHVTLMGNAQISSQAVRELSARSIPVAWLSSGGWFNGVLDGLGHGHVALRREQYRAADDYRALALSRSFVEAKVLNARTFLRRNHETVEGSVLHELARIAERAKTAESVDSLLGIEGNAARLYFSNFQGLLVSGSVMSTFDFTTRNRRPPKDPINALLSFAYTLLARDLSVASRIVGLDPYLGYLHQPRYGRPSLALDLMEEFRPIVADSVVVNVVNTGVIGRGDFIARGAGVVLNAEGRKKFLRAWERRLAEHITHPLFGYRVSYRRVFEMQARLLGRYLLGELEVYPGFKTR